MTIKQRIDFEQRKEQILESVSCLFAEKGLAVTTKELASAAGVSEALIYKHFKSKEELFDEVKSRCCNAVKNIAEQVLVNKSLEERLALSMVLVSYAVLVGFEEDILPKKEVHKLLLQSLSSKGEFALQMFGNFGRWVEVICADMEEAKKTGFLTKGLLSNEESLWMAHHFLIGMAATRLPEVKLDIFEIKENEIIKKAATQAFIMIGMEHSKAEEKIIKAIKELNKIKGVRNV